MGFAQNRTSWNTVCVSVMMIVTIPSILSISFSGAVVLCSAFIYAIDKWCTMYLLSLFHRDSKNERISQHLSPSSFATSRADKLWKIPFSLGSKKFPTKLVLHFTQFYKQTHKFSHSFSFLSDTDGFFFTLASNSRYQTKAGLIFSLKLLSLICSNSFCIHCEPHNFQYR